MESLSALVERTRQGDRQAERALHERLRPYIRTLADRHWTDAHNGDVDESDLTQQTLLQVAKSIPEYRGSNDAQFKAWIREILKHKAVDLLRKRLPAASLDQSVAGRPLGEQVPSDESTPSSPAVRLERANQLDAAMRQLSEDQRRAVRLRHFEGLSIPEISRQLNDRSPEAVRQLIRRGIVKLGDLLPESM